MPASRNRLGGLFTRDQLKAARLKEIKNLFRRNRERRTTLPSIQRESKIDVHTTWFQQARYKVGIFSAAGWVNGAETGVFQNVIKGMIECIWQGENVVV